MEMNIVTHRKDNLFTYGKLKSRQYVIMVMLVCTHEFVELEDVFITEQLFHAFTASCLNSPPFKRAKQLSARSPLLLMFHAFYIGNNVNVQEGDDGTNKLS